jgi:hypothetical protein
MEAFGPSTQPGIGPHELGPDAVAPDTIRDGTAPLAAPQRLATTMPIARVVTVPLARVATRAARLTYDVYTPDDTLRGVQALGATEAECATRRRARRRRVGLGALGLALTLGTTLMAMGSCDDGATGRVETTAAITPIAPASTRTVAPLSATAPVPSTDDVIPPITFSPPLSPPPRRRSPGRAPTR